MPRVACRRCFREFYVKPNRLERGWGKYCSNECKHLDQKTGKFIPCFVCHKKSYKHQKLLERSRSGRFFCSKSCQTVWRNTEIYVGSSHANWKGGESSYRDILRRSGIARTCSKCQTNDIRILTVHHKDKNRQNNAIQNLIWLCHNCHFLIHHYANETEGFIA